MAYPIYFYNIIYKKSAQKNATFRSVFEKLKSPLCFYQKMLQLQIMVSGILRDSKYIQNISDNYK